LPSSHADFFHSRKETVASGLDLLQNACIEIKVITRLAQMLKEDIIQIHAG